MDGPARPLTDHLGAVLTQHATRIGHVVEDVAATDGAALVLRRDVVDFADLHGHDVTVFGQSRRHQADVSPAIGSHGRHRLVNRAQDEIWRSDRPCSGIGKIPRRWHVGPVAFRSSVVRPCLNLGQLFAAERIVVLEGGVDADVLLHEPRGHRAHAIPDGGAVPNPPGHWPYFVVAPERHGCATTCAVAAYATALEDGRDVSRVRDRGRIDAEVGCSVQMQLVVSDTRIVRLSAHRDRQRKKG